MQRIYPGKGDWGNCTL